MTDTSDEVCEEFRRIILEGVEHPSLRRMLEHLISKGDIQRACILKEMQTAIQRDTLTQPTEDAPASITHGHAPSAPPHNER